MTIKEILERPPEELLALSDAELRNLLEPFFPATRTPLLPQEKARKLGVEVRAMKDAVENSKDDLKKMLELINKK
jgi:hypothetical protein